MADLADMAQMQEPPEGTLVPKRPEGPQPTGHCLNCSEPLPESNRRWCGHECYEDWSYRNEQRTHRAR
jgi:hypothetical protein